MNQYLTKYAGVTKNTPHGKEGGVYTLRKEWL